MFEFQRLKNCIWAVETWRDGAFVSDHFCPNQQKTQMNFKHYEKELC